MSKSTIVENAEKIASSLGMSSLEVVVQNEKSVTIRGTAAYVRVRKHLQAQLGTPRNESAPNADCAQHCWHRPELGQVTIQGSLYSGRDSSAKMAITFNSV